MSDLRPDRVRDTDAMISGMAPVLDPDTYVFCTLPTGVDVEGAIDVALASFKEDEVMSLILPLAQAERLGIETEIPMRRLTLTVNSALDGVGLTAAVANALAAEGIACNMVSATQHDHAFVLAKDAERALALLEQLARK